MNHQNHNTESRKNKHLNAKERFTIELHLKDGYSAYKISLIHIAHLRKVQMNVIMV